MQNNLGKKIRKILTSDFLIFIILLNVICVVYHFTQKNDFHVDEICSFGSANSRSGPFLFKGVNTYFEDVHQSAYNKTYEGTDFHNYIVVKKGLGFDYVNLWHNMEKDAHPPLYFAILHTICSFFPDTFSKWLGLPINIISLIISLLFIYKISQKIFSNKNISYLSVIFFGFCLATLSMAVYIRSYMLQMCLSLWLFWEHIQLLEKNKFDGKIFTKIFLAAVLGYLTHYYLLVNAFFLSGVTCFIFLKNKNFKLLWQYALLMTASVISFFIIYFPAADVLLHSQRGTETLGHSLYYYLTNLEKLLSRPFELVLHHILALDALPIKYFILVVVFLYVFVKMYGTDKVSNDKAFLLLYTIPCAICLGLIFPEMYEFNSRYFSPLVPMLCILIIYGINKVLEVLRLKQVGRFYILSILVVANVFMTDFSRRSVFSLEGSEKLTKVINDVKGANILYIGNIQDIISLSWILCKTKGVSFLSKHDKNNNYIIENDNYDYIILYNKTIKDSLQEAVASNSLSVFSDKYLFTFRQGAYIYDFYNIKPKQMMGYKKDEDYI